MKKRIIFLLMLMLSMLTFARTDYIIENIKIKEDNGLYYKIEGEQSFLLNEESVIFGEQSLKVPIFEIDFKEGKIKSIKFSNANNYFSPLNKEEKINFNLQRIGDKKFNGNIEYKKEKKQEVKKNEKTENSTSTFYSSSSANSYMSYYGEFEAKRIFKFLNKFLKSKKDDKVVVSKVDLDELVQKK